MTLHYQPIRHLATGRDCGVQPLLRWTDSELGPVAPAEFIPVAQHTGEIHDIDSWVVDQACAQARLWTDAGTPLKIVNYGTSPGLPCSFGNWSTPVSA
ncbi:EAL domain-containing protein [Arthrobacter sp. 24S4-2]|uniref:EAL domain-containing protein n=1 Tax=Arthrobacter sp. 24S4-2 TaxID=2575374 RepID=UPI001C2FA4D6